MYRIISLKCNLASLGVSIILKIEVKMLAPSQARDRGEGAERAGGMADDPPPRSTRPRRQDVHGADRHYREPPAGPRHASATDQDPLAGGREACDNGQRDKLVDSRVLTISEHKINE